MAEEQDWAKRRQRIVKCKIHGLSYDPEMTSGCVRCRKEGLDTQPRQRPQLVILLLALLGIAVIAYRIIEAERATSVLFDANNEPAVVDTAGSSSSSLDAEAYRQPLQAIDHALFEASASDLNAISDQIASTFRQLSWELEDNTSPEASAASQAINDLTADIGETISLDSLQELRIRWSQLRRQHFGQAQWYAVVDRTDRRTDRAALTLYHSVTSSLASLLSEGADLAQSLAEPVAINLVDPEDQARKAEEWRVFQSDWRQQITELKKQLPARPDARSTPEILVATQRLDQAFSKILSLTNGSLPSEAHLDEAHGAIENAQRAFEELLK